MEASSFRRQAPGRVYDFLPPEPAARQPRRAAPPADVADAEFVVVGRSRPQGFHARSFNDNRKRTATARPSGPSPSKVAPLLHAAEAWLQQASVKSFAALVGALFILVFGLAGGFSGLSEDPGAAAGSPLGFSHVTVTPREANGMRILLINGIIDNDSGTTQGVRPIRADLRNGEQLLASVVINPPIDVIYAGQSRGFSTRMQYAGGKMPEVRLSFMP